MTKYIKNILFIGLVLLGLISCDNTLKYENHKPMNIRVKGNSDTLDKVQKLFNEQNYELANVHLSRMAHYYSNNEEIQLYYAITFLETDQYALAKIKFEKLLLSTNATFVNDAKWYLALMAFKQNDLTTCKTYLEQIPEDASIYKKTKSLLKNI